MYTRRSFLAATGTAAVAATAGCLDFILGDDLTFEATAPSVSGAALSETGYEERRVEELSMEREFEAGGESRTVGITNWRAEYDRRIDLPVGESQRAATFTAFSTPKAEVLGQTFNPVGDMSTAEIVEMAQDRYEGLGDVRRQDETTETLLGKSTTVTQFAGTADLAETGQEIDVELQVTEAVGSGDDYVLAIGGYPEPLADDERDNYFTLLGGVQHDG